MFITILIDWFLSEYLRYSGKIPEDNVWLRILFNGELINV